jgi:serine/threonine-protein kinase RsbW
MREDDCIKLSFPMNPAYVSSARLTTSSIAKRMNFDIDEIEDIKAAVSETCTYLLKTLPITVNNNFDITFKLHKVEVTMEIVLSVNAKPIGKTNAISLMMIKSLVDDFSIDENGPVVITMVKKHKEFLID